MIQLEIENIKLRAIEPSDANLIYQWENDPSLWNVSGIITPYSKFQIEQYVLSEGDIYQNKQIKFMIDLKPENLSIGCIDLFNFDPINKRAEVGILIYPQEHRRKGYASHALNLIKQYAFVTLSLHQLYCTVSANNSGSLKCMIKSGFKESGTKKDWNREGENWIDVVFMQCINK